MTNDPGNGHPFSWPISEFAHSIGAKSLAMLVGYFDDSGTHRGSGVCVIAGLVSNSIYWGRLELEWQALTLDAPSTGIT